MVASVVGTTRVIDVRMPTCASRTKSDPQSPMCHSDVLHRNMGLIIYAFQAILMRC
jgi:hypothetical protein